MNDNDSRSVQFTAQDRCDRCGAQAYVGAERDGMELLFCLHHGKEHHLALQVDGWNPSYDFEAIDRLMEPDRVPA